MTHLDFLPQLTFPANPLALFGLLLLAGLIGGELVKRALRLPRITGYVLMGMLLGASGFGLLDDKLIAEVEAGVSDAGWLRETYRRYNSLNDVARLQSDLWMGRAGQNP